MDRDTSMKFKALFEEQKNAIVFNKAIVSEDFAFSKDDVLDESDLTSTEMETSMRMRLRNREALYLRKIEESLKRIQDGSFGLCEDCEDEIEPRRLEARPTTTLCMSCKEASERKEMVHIDGHRTKSLGRLLRMA